MKTERALKRGLELLRNVCAGVAGSRDTKWECALTETGARFKDLVCNPPPMERTEKENIVQVRYT